MQYHFRAEAAGESRAPSAGVSSAATFFRSWSSARSGKRSPGPASFRSVCFPPLEQVAVSFYQLTISGVLPHHTIETIFRLFERLCARRRFSGVAIGVMMGRSRRAEDILLPLVSNRRADPRPRLRAAVFAVVRPRQFSRQLLLVGFVLGLSDHFHSWTGVRR